MLLFITIFKKLLMGVLVSVLIQISSLNSAQHDLILSWMDSPGAQTNNHDA